MTGRVLGAVARTPKRWVWFLIVVAALAVVPFGLSSFHLFVATRILVLAIFAMAYDLVFGYGGMPSLGHAAFFGIGAYSLGLGVTRWDMEFAEVVLVALLIGALLGLVTGLLTARTRGIHLLLLTLALAQALWGLAFQQVGLTRGDNGISNIGRGALPTALQSTTGYYLFVLGGAVVVFVVLNRYVQSSLGRVLVGARESETRMSAMGYRVSVYRIAAFVVSGSLSALAGVFSVLLIQFVNPDVLNWPLSAEVLLIAILGGAGTLYGPAIGAGFLVGFETFVSAFSDRWILALGVTYILVILLLPGGLVSLISREKGPFRRGRMFKPPVSDQTSASPELDIDDPVSPLVTPSWNGTSRLAENRAPVLDRVAVETVGLSRYFEGVAAVNEVDLRVMQGERRAVIGPNGAGKTTLFHLVSGQLRPSAGRVSILGSDVTNWPDYRRARLGVGRTFQITNLLPRLTVFENVILAVAAHPRERLRLHRSLHSDPALVERAHDLLETWHLADRGEALAREIPYGAQRLLEIVLAVATEPKVLLLDEPTAGLSPEDAMRLVETIGAMPEEMTIVLIEHDMDVAFSIADSVTVLSEGKELVTGSPNAIRQREDVLTAYMRQVPQ